MFKLSFIFDIAISPNLHDLCGVRNINCIYITYGYSEIIYTKIFFYLGYTKYLVFSFIY